MARENETDEAMPGDLDGLAVPAGEADLHGPGDASRSEDGAPPALEALDGFPEEPATWVPDASPTEGRTRRRGGGGHAHETQATTAWRSAAVGMLHARVPPDLVCRPMSLGILRGHGPGTGHLAAALDATAFNPKSDAHKMLCERVLVEEAVVRQAKECDTPGKFAEAVRALMLDGCGVVVACDGPLAAGLEAEADWTFVLGDQRERLAFALAAMRDDGYGLDAPGGRAESEVLSGTPLPAQRAGAALGWLRGVARAGTVTTGDLADLERFATRPLGAVPDAMDGPRTLSEVKGLPPALAERLSVLSRRISGPCANPPGVLLEGPTGTGKTMLARILARESGRHFVQASVADWQGAGYLQDMMGAMRRSFDEARRHAPSVMFLDELDSIGRRGTGERNEQFWTLMINGFLEHLHGIAGRGDVVVVGATNNAHAIDPAVLRSGRFGETLHVPNPDRNGRADILRVLLPDLTRSVDAGMLADRVGDCSPATMRGLADEVAALSRGRQATVADLEAALASAASRTLSGLDHGRLVPLLAAGLCAQALVMRAAYGDRVDVRGVSVRPGLSDLGRVSASHADGAFPSETAIDLMRSLHVQVAGNVGRRLAAGRLASAGDPGALSMFSHLTHGEDARAEATARTLARSGRHGPVSASDGGREADVAARAILEGARRDVRAMLSRSGPALDAAARELAASGTLSAHDLARLLGMPEPRPEPAATLH